MRAFADPLRPAFEETGIDQLQVRVSADFRCSSGSTAAEYLEAFATADPEIDWFTLPAGRGREVTLRTRRNPSATIKAEITARMISDHHVTVRFAFRCNPTRTLAHTFHALRNHPDIPVALNEMSPVEFFAAVADVPRSLNDDTNWLADIDAVKAVFGEDVFSAYLPIYVLQLRSLTARLLAPTFDAEVRDDGDADVIVSSLGETRVNWSRASAPQAEAYFERYHASAQATVRCAAQNALDSLDEAKVRRHIGDTTFEREGAWFSLRCALPNELSLSMYAKVPDRLRFEISRKSAGRYDDPLQPGASGRLLAILSSERRRLLTACDWHTAGELLADHSVPVPGDLLDMIAAVEAVCCTTGHQFQPVIRSLLLDAGISRTPANVELIEALVRHGIICRTTLRQRDRSRPPKRYALTEPYLAAQRATLTAMSGSDRRDTHLD